jgi:autotransporter-associated beta strand protein
MMQTQTSLRLIIPAPIGRWIVAILGASLLAVTASAQTLYWDTNGATGGAGATPTGTWNGFTSNWSTNSGGTVATTTWTNGRDAVFSAGTDAVNSYTVTVTGTRNVSSITIEEGTPTFTGGTIGFTDATPDFTVGTGRTTTVNSSITGTNGMNKLGAGTLIFGTSDKAYSGTTTISAGTLQLDFNQTFTTVALAGGTLLLNSASTSITTLNVTANSTIDFSSSTAATLNLTNLTISAGVTLTVANWTNATDFFYTTNWTGAVYNTTGTTPMNQVAFNGFSSTNTKWQSYDNQVTPLPEPSTYGALFLGALTSLMVVRRWRTSRAG